MTMIGILIAVIVRSTATNADFIVDDVRHNKGRIEVNTEHIAENKQAIVENRVNVANTMAILNEIKTDIREIKVFVVGKE